MRGVAIITWGELDTAINTIGELYKKYYKLRHPGEKLGNLEPDLPAGWDRIFDTAWKYQLPRETKQRSLVTSLTPPT